MGAMSDLALARDEGMTVRDFDDLRRLTPEQRRREMDARERRALAVAKLKAAGKWPE